MEKIVRTVCLFSESFQEKELSIFDTLLSLLHRKGFAVQTKRLCLPGYIEGSIDQELAARNILLGFGSQSYSTFRDHFDDFLLSSNKAVSLDITHEQVTEEHVRILFDIIKNKPENTFRFSYGCNIPPSSPYFPSATFGTKGWSVGLQATNLAVSCLTLEEWLQRLKSCWEEIHGLFNGMPGYLGIDSSIAPLFRGPGSFIGFIKRLMQTFEESVTTDIYTVISSFISSENPHPIGLCGLMFPCLEDMELADEYEHGNFTVERNIFLSLHSGLGIDTMPIAIDDDPTVVLRILRLIQALSRKYKKPLSARFVSDGKTRIGSKTCFNNPYLQDVTLRRLGKFYSQT